MLRRKKVDFENMDLKPQPIGYTYKKKSNFGRVIFIFALLILAVYYIDDISLYINNLIGKDSATIIKENAKEEKPILDFLQTQKVEPNYYELSNNTEISFKDLTLKNFKTENNILSFDIVNSTFNDINLTNNKVFLELYNSEKSLLNRYKLDFGIISQNGLKNYSLNLKDSSFAYFNIIEKSIADYPNIELVKDENGNSVLTCKNDIEKYTYSFTNDNLKKVLFEANVAISTDNYSDKMNAYRDTINKYKGNTGVTTYFSSNSNGFIGKIEVNYETVGSQVELDKYYFTANELSKVVSFEMNTYGYTCN